MPYSNHRSGKQCASPSGFTLIELLIVVGIITILIVLGLSVAGKVAGVGKVRATEQTLRVLDTALSQWINANGQTNPPAWIIDPREANTNGKYIQPILDAKCDTSGQMINSVGMFLFQCKSVPAAAGALKQLDSRFLREYTPDATVNGWDTQVSLPTAFDAWNHPIHYVVPQSKGLIGTPTNNPTAAVNVTTVLGTPPAGKTYGMTMVRRNNQNSSAGASPPDADSDGGINPTPRPYFYSAGPDGDPSTVDDNVYITVPRIQKN